MGSGAPGFSAILSVAELVEHEYGIRGLLNRRVDNPVIGVNPLPIFTADPRRVLYLISNPDIANLWVAEDDNVAVNRGYLVAAQGGLLTRKWRDDLTTVSDPLWGVSAAGNITLYVVEWKLF